MDRSIARILSLPVFDDQFVAALRKLNLDRVEFWMVLTESDSSSVSIDVCDMLSVMTGSDRDSVNLIMSKPEVVDLLGQIVGRSRERIEAEIASDLGFGMANAPSSTVRIGRDDYTLVLPKAMAMLPSKRPAPTGSRSETRSLQTAEETERTKWGRRLQLISERAGACAKINDKSRFQGMSPVDQAVMKKMVFEAGGYRTIRIHVRAWEKLEEWSTERFISLYPVTSQVLIRYCLHLEHQQCGPAVIPAFRASVAWICRRLALECPDLKDPAITAIADKVSLDRGKELKEAAPMPIPLVAAIEIYHEHLLDSGASATAFFAWWVLVLIFSSLRFDDGLHVSPTSLKLTEDALYGVVWQTKVERKRRGTRFAVPRCSVSGTDWIQRGWDNFQVYLTDRDFFIWDLKGPNEFDKNPVSYSRSTAWLKFVCTASISHAVKVGMLTDDDSKLLDESVQKITWHSMRVTMLDAAVRSKVDDKLIGLQANWKNPGPLVLKYARQRKELSVAMVRDLASQLREDWVPDVEKFTVEDEVKFVVEPQGVQYVVKSQVPGKTGITDLKCHIKNLDIDPEYTLCRRLKLDDAVSVGVNPPSSVCLACSKRI